MSEDRRQKSKIGKRKPELTVKIGKLRLKNPVMVASGTFGYGTEYIDLIEPGFPGALVTKTITLNPRPGNPPPRTAETPAGMLNAIGLENVGLAAFLEEKLPELEEFETEIITSIAGDNAAEFVKLAKVLGQDRRVSALEINISCPNLTGSSAGKTLVAQDPRATYRVVSRVRKATGKTIITKLSPNVTDIAVIARAAEEAGSDAVSLINTLTGMTVDIETKRPRLANLTGGLSGPAVRPVALRMVWEVSREVSIPVVGMGGILHPEDALEFIIAGATAVAVGTGNFVDPGAVRRIIDGISDYLRKKKLSSIRKLIGTLKVCG